MDVGRTEPGTHFRCGEVVPMSSDLVETPTWSLVALVFARFMFDLLYHTVSICIPKYHMSSDPSWDNRYIYIHYIYVYIQYIYIYPLTWATDIPGWDFADSHGIHGPASGASNGTKKQVALGSAMVCVSEDVESRPVRVVSRWWWFPSYKWVIVKIPLTSSIDHL